MAVNGVTWDTKSRSWDDIWQTWEMKSLWKCSMELGEQLHSLSLLCSLVLSLPLALFCPSVELLQWAGRDRLKIWNHISSTPWTGFASHPYTLWCPDVPWGALWIEALIGWLSAGASGVCVFREERDSWGICGSHYRDLCGNELAFPLMACGSWLGVHREADFSLSSSVKMMCATVPRVQPCVQQHECEVTEVFTERGLCQVWLS